MEYIEMAYYFAIDILLLNSCWRMMMEEDL